MSEPVDEVHQVLATAVRTAVMAAGQVAEFIAARRAETYRRAEHASAAEARQTTARLRAERQAATPVMRQVWTEQWWRTATPQQIAEVYQVAAGWAGEGDPHAQATAAHMREQIHTRYQVTIGHSHALPHDLVALLAAEPEPQRPERGVAHSESMRTAAEQDRAAAAALENLADQEAAAAVRTAAEGYSHTPSGRLAQAGRGTRGPARGSHSLGQQRHNELGR